MPHRARLPRSVLTVHMLAAVPPGRATFDEAAARAGRKALRHYRRCRIPSGWPAAAP